jgi:alanine racemase
MQVRTVRTGCSIGYGNSFTASRNSRIATLSVGYADGLMRALSNCGYVLIHGMRLPIVGKISMDLTLVDATEATEVAVGDEAVLIGKQGNLEIRVEELASLAHTIPYEILTRIGARVPRVYLGRELGF